MTNEISEKLAKMFIQTQDGWKLITQHVADIVEQRSMILTGDKEHLSILNILKLWEKTGSPKKHEWEDPQKQFSNLFNHSFVPPYWGFLKNAPVLDLSKEKAIKVISGEEEIIIEMSSMTCCYDCMSSFVTKIRGNSVHLSCQESCESNREFTVEIDFPTGEIVFADWPEFFEEAREEGIISCKDHDINYLKGIKAQTKDYEGYNIFHSFVGNSNPSLFVSKGLGKIRIGKGNRGFKEVGSFSTQLWWTTIIDKKFHDQIIEKIPGAKSEERDIAKVKPGRYKFTIHDHHDRDHDDYDYEALYASAEWIGECLKTDFVFEEKSLMEWDDAVKTYAGKWYSENLVPTNSFDFVENKIVESIFNGLGTGLGTYGELISNFSNDQVISIPKEAFTPSEGENFIPYPNFNKMYSSAWNVDLNKLPDSWILAAIRYFSRNLEYFKAGASGYSHAYDPESPKNKRLSQEFLDYVNKKRDKFRNDQDFYDHITKEYGGVAIWNGDVEQFRAKRWEIEKNRIIEFCNETLERLNNRLEQKT